MRNVNQTTATGASDAADALGSPGLASASDRAAVVSTIAEALRGHDELIVDDRGISCECGHLYQAEIWALVTDEERSGHEAEAIVSEIGSIFGQRPRPRGPRTGQQASADAAAADRWVRPSRQLVADAVRRHIWDPEEDDRCACGHELGDEHPGNAWIDHLADVVVALGRPQESSGPTAGRDLTAPPADRIGKLREETALATPGTWRQDEWRVIDDNDEGEVAYVDGPWWRADADGGHIARWSPATAEHVLELVQDVLDHRDPARVEVCALTVLDALDGGMP